MEKRDEIKNGVQAKLIDILAEQISKEADFETLKNELLQELVQLAPSKPEGRQLNEDDGYDPINERETKYKKEFGFIFNPEPVKKHLEDLKEKHQELVDSLTYPKSSLSEILKNSSSTKIYAPEPIKKSSPASFSNKFANKFPEMREILEKMPLNDLRILSDLRATMSKKFSNDSQELFKDAIPDLNPAEGSYTKAMEEHLELNPNVSLPIGMTNTQLETPKSPAKKKHVKRPVKKTAKRNKRR